MTLFHAIIIALLQGVSELFPVSSLGHAVLVPKLLRWSLNEQSPTWLAFLVALHLGTAAALLIYFRAEWMSVVMALVRSVQRGQMSGDHDERLAWMVILGTIPAGLVGLILQKPLEKLFASPYAAAIFLIVNGIVMFAGEWLLQRQMTARRGEVRELQPAVGGGRVVARPLTAGATRYRDITELSWRDAAVVGFAQIGALFPGISRSGITMVAGLAAGLTHEASARYTFLLATPIIAAAGVLEMPKLFTHAGQSILGDAMIGMVLAGIAAYLSVRFLMRYFHLGNRLEPFAYYCVAAGVMSLLLLSIGL